jgi:hypothetical protein
MIACDPAAHLALEIALRLAQIGETDGREINFVEAGEVVDERFAKPARDGWRERETRRRISAKDDSADRLHQVKGSAEDGGIVAVKKNLGCRGISAVEFREDVELASHVMCRLDLTAEGRPAQNHSAMTKLQRIGEIRMAARKLLNTEMLRFVGEMGTQERLEFAKIEFLPGANGTWLVAEVGHIYSVLLH